MITDRCTERKKIKEAKYQKLHKFITDMFELYRAIYYVRFMDMFTLLCSTYFHFEEQRRKSGQGELVVIGARGPVGRLGGVPTKGRILSSACGTLHTLPTRKSPSVTILLPCVHVIPTSFNVKTVPFSLRGGKGSQRETKR